MATRESRLAIYGFYVNSGLREVIPIYPLYAIMFGEHGVAPFEIGLLFAIWCVVGLVLEVPSGAVADRYSRKWLVVASGALKSAAFLSWYLWQDFAGYALGFLLWGAGSSLRSGAWEALLFDLLKSWQEEQRFVAIFGRARALALLGVGLGELLGGVLIVRGYDEVLLVSMVVPLVATLPFMLWVPDSEREARNREDQPGLAAILREGVREATTNRTVLYLLLVLSLLTSCWGVYDEFVTPTLREKGFPLHLVAYLGAVIYCAESLGMLIAGMVERLAIANLLRIIAGAAILLQVAVWGVEWSAVCAIALFAFLFGLTGTHFEGHLQHAIASATRATVTSTVGFGQGLVSIVAFLLFGWVAQYHGMIGGTFATSLLVLLLAILFARLDHRWFGAP